MSVTGTPGLERPPSPIGSLFARLRDVRVERGDALTFVALGAVAIFLFVCEAATGALLALYYRPTIADANASVRFIVTDVEFGAVVRTLHIACANLLIVVLVVTLAWLLVRRAYRPPHGLAWACTVGLLLVQIAEAFTGGLLPWTRRSVVEAEISASLIGQLPVVGTDSRAVMLGAHRVSDLALVRVLGLHAGMLPMLATAIVAVIAMHAAGSLLARRVPPLGSSSPLVPDVTLRIAAVCASVAIIVLATASVWSPELGAAAGTTAVTGRGLRPSWFTLFAHNALRATPATILGMPGARVIGTTFVLFALLAIAFPAIDRKGSRYGQALGLIAIGTFVEETLRALLA